MSGTKQLSAGQRAYEEKRAAKAGVSLDRWLTMKEKERAAEEKARQQAAEPPKVKKPSFLSRLIERGHKPLKS